MRVVARRSTRMRGFASGVATCVEYHGVREVGDEAAERVALRRRGQRLAHDRGADHHAERVEGDFGPVAVRVPDQARLQHAVVVPGERQAPATRALRR